MLEQKADRWISYLCSELGVSTSGYDMPCNREASQRKFYEDASFTVFHSTFELLCKASSSPRILDMLKDFGYKLRLGLDCSSNE